MSPKGRPEGEYRSAKREGTPMSERGEAKARRARPRAIASGRHLGRSIVKGGAEAGA